MWNGICHGLSMVGPVPDEAAAWKTVFPDHLVTDLSMRRIVDAWQQINESDAPVICNVVD